MTGKEIDKGVIKQLACATKNYNLSVREISDVLGVPKHSVAEYLNRAGEYGYLTTKERKAWIKAREGHRKIFDNNSLRNFIEDIFSNNLSTREAKIKYNMSLATIGLYINKAIELGYIAQEKREEWRKNQLSKNFRNILKTSGKQGFIDFCSSAWKKGHGNNHKRLREIARLGGLAAQILHPEIRENIENSQNYGATRCDYGRVEFASLGERFLAVFLLEYAVVPEIIPNENFQVGISEKKKLDFLVQNQKGKWIAIEYHPVPKNHSKLIYKSARHYKSCRNEEIKEAGLDCELVVISKIGDIYPQLRKADILLDNFDIYMRIVKRAIEKIKYFDQTGEIETRE